MDQLPATCPCLPGCNALRRTSWLSPSSRRRVRNLCGLAGVMSLLLFGVGCSDGATNKIVQLGKIGPKTASSSSASALPGGSLPGSDPQSPTVDPVTGQPTVEPQTVTGTTTQGGSTGTQSNPVITNNGPWTVYDGGYVSSGPWHGYSWTATAGAGSSVNPQSFASAKAGSKLCASGAVAAMSDYSGVGMLGINLAQDLGTGSASPAVGTVRPGGAGLAYQLENSGGSALRIQIQAADGATNPNARWCAAVSGNSGVISWNQFNTQCWEGGKGSAYDGNTPIAAALVLVPGGNTSTTSFNFCVNSLGQSATGGSSGGGSTGGGTSGGGTTPTNPITNGKSGWGSRYWDCCKPHCAWPSNGGTVQTCGGNGQTLDANTQSACNGGGGYMCTSMVPHEVSAGVSYAYAATNPASCGACYRLQFTGSSKNAGNDSGSAVIKGKQMIVKVVNTGGDVGSGQFDFLIPGGGVGAFNACSQQWGVSSGNLGAQYGGFLSTCKSQGGSYDSYKGCVLNMCRSVFGSRADLKAGCEWFVNWYGAADNPNFVYESVSCPSGI